LDAIEIERECTPTQQVQLDAPTQPDLAPRVQAMPTQSV
jgi:hypothetical protein